MIDLLAYFGLAVFIGVLWSAAHLSWRAKHPRTRGYAPNGKTERNDIPPPPRGRS